MSTQLLEALTDGNAMAVTKRNNPTILPIIPPMINSFSPYPLVMAFNITPLSLDERE